MRAKLADIQLCISLPHREDRRKALLENWEHTGIEDPEFVDGVLLKPDQFSEREVRNVEAYGNPEKKKDSKYLAGVAGTRRAHLNALSIGHRDINTLLVVEDDCRFNILARDKFYETISYHAMFRLPKEWDMLYLSCAHREPPRRYDSLFGRITACRLTTAIIYNVASLGKIRSLLEDCDREVDYFWETKQRSGEVNAYCLIRDICYQEPGFSDAAGKFIVQPNKTAREG